jgi:zinc protease
MKKLIILFFYLSPLVLMAQVDRTHAPKPSIAPQVKIAKPVTFTLANGLKVYVVENHKLPKVTANLTFDILPFAEKDKAGMSDMMGSLVRRGTATMEKAQLDEAIDFLGARVSTSASGVSAFSLKKNFPKAMSLMADIVLKPSFPAKEFDKIRNQELAGLAQEKNDPSAISRNVVHVLNYGKDHPYGELTTEQTVKNVTIDDIKNYYNTYWKPNIAYLVFVGDISAAEARKLAEQYFGSWKKGVVPQAKYALPKQPAKTNIAIVDRPSSVQSIITISTPVELNFGAPDVIPASVMSNILGGGIAGGRLFDNLREKHAFTYGASSSLNPDRIIGSFTASASVRNEKTDSAVAEFLNEFKRIRTEAVVDTEVTGMKNFLSGRFARSLEDPATIARFALNIARYNLPADYYENYLKNMALVTPPQVQQMANKYILPGNVNIVIVGNAKEISKGLDKYGEVKYFDVYGNEIEAPTVKKVDAAVSAQSILEKASAAVGAPQAIASIKDIELNGEASIMGNAIAISEKHIIPSAFSLTATMSGMEVQKQTLKDGKYTIAQQGRTKEADEKDKEEMNEKAAFFGDAYLLKQTGNKYEVTGIEKVDGKDAYVLHVKTAAGREFTNYYDVATGLQVKSSSVRDAGPMGQITIQTFLSDYKAFNGVQIPTHVVVDLGQFKQDITFKDIKVNSGLKAEDIK